MHSVLHQQLPSLFYQQKKNNYHRFGIVLSKSTKTIVRTTWGSNKAHKNSNNYYFIYNGNAS